MGITDIRFLVIATGYNCEKFAADCVRSVEAGKEHMKAINEPLYVYTVSNPISVMNRFSHKQRQEEYRKICSIKPKERIKKL